MMEHTNWPVCAGINQEHDSPETATAYVQRIQAALGGGKREIFVTAKLFKDLEQEMDGRDWRGNPSPEGYSVLVIGDLTVRRAPI